MLRLYTFTISHFSEKARWGLDLQRIAYDEKRLLPGLHTLTIRRLAPRTSVPTLVHDGHVVQGSSAILDYAEQRLGAMALLPPAGAAERGKELEARADRAFGLGTQRIFYGALLARPRAIIDMWTQDGPRWGRAYYTVAFPLLRRALRRMYKIRPAPLAEAQDLYKRTFDETDRILATSPYLLGDRLSRLDVTVASLLAPLCRPPEHVLRWPTRGDEPAEIQEFVRQFEGRPTWDFVLRMYREHRRGAA